MSEAEEWFGYLWPPGQMEHLATPGHVSYRPEDGLKVRLIGAFSVYDLRAIHGTFERVPITLVDCIATSTHKQGLIQPVPVRQDIEPQLLLYGINLNDPAEPCFKALDIEIENLSRWSADQDMTLKLEFDDRLAPSDQDDESTGGRIRRTLKRVFRRRPPQVSQPVQTVPTGYASWGVEGKPTDERRAQMDDMTAELRRSRTLPNWDEHRDRTVGRIAARSVLHFSSTRSRTAEQWEEVARMAQDLLSLATFSPCALLRETLIPDDAKVASDNTARSDVHLYAKQLVRGAPNEPAMEPWAMLFNLSDIDFGVLLPQWSKVRDMLRPTCNMVLGLKYIPEGYLETKLLTATGAAEVMEGSLAHGLDRPLPVPKVKYKVLRKELLCLAPAEYRDWLDKKLYNTPSLHDKLKLLAGQLDKQITDKLLPNVELWAQRTTTARNDLTHRGESKSVPAMEMSAIVNVTVAVIVISLLTQLGIPTARIVQALEQHPDLRHAPDLARRYWPAKNPDNGATASHPSQASPSP
ncbi:HEPN domain-containing protein [Mycobacterium rhizamassiliense]|uniref:ApeA N-terminal domain 1-containing protein n=1 Tax=Mycobacterium rhizamassiliense TaxID=1841860 RepID=UPI0012FF6AD1|nr:HEPN domain-containing protein [Mycobacterium rhizamassiliense]